MIALRPSTTGPDKAAFHRYLDGIGSVQDELALLKSSVDCRDALPIRCADLLSLPPAATYRDAVQLLLAPWAIVRHGAF